MGVDHSRHAPKLGQHAVGDLTIPLQIRSIDLNIDWSRQPEIEDLANHIRGQKIEHDSRIFLSQLCSQLTHIVGCGAVLGFKRDHDVRIVGADPKEIVGGGELAGGVAGEG